MIKLVASDLDGTLLTPDKRLTDRSAAAIRLLREKGIQFAAASGRQYFNILEVFQKRGMDKGMTFIAENGTLVVRDGEVLSVNVLDDDLVREVVLLCRKLPSVRPVLCGAQSAWLEDDDEATRFQAARYFARRRLLPDVLASLEKDRIVKIALLEVNGQAETGCYPYFKRFAEQAQVLLSGPEWVDIINQGVSKGTALRMVGESYGAGYEEMMAFGDYLNDAEMLKACKHSFAMENAHPNLKKVAAHICGSNDNEGVAETLIEWFQLPL